jgi:hypothetical protein
MGWGFILRAEADMLLATVANGAQGTQVYKLNPDFNETTHLIIHPVRFAKKFCRQD